MKKFRKLNEEKGIILLLFFLFLLFLVLHFIAPLLLWDENVYLANARGHITKTNFQEDFRFPLLEYIIALFWIFTGESIFFARLLVIFFSLGTVYLTYAVSKNFFSKKESLIVAILFASQTIYWSFRAYGDIPALFFVMLSFYLLSKEKIYCTIFAGICAALAFLIRFPLFIFGLSTGVIFLFTKHYKKLLLFLLFFSLTLTPWLAYNQLHYGDVVWDLRAQHSAVEQYTQKEPISMMATNMFSSAGFLVFLLPFGLYFLAKKAKKKSHLNYLIVLYVLFSLVYYTFFVNLKLPRYMLSFLPFLCIASYSCLCWIRKSKKGKKAKKSFQIFFILTIISTILLFLGNIGVIAAEGSCVRNGSIAQTINYLKGEVESNDTILSNFWPWFGYYLNVRVASLWSSNVTELLQIYSPRYIVYNDKVGIFYNKTILDTSPSLKLEKVIEGRCGQNAAIYKVI